jgi:hypothetical protein
MVTTLGLSKFFFVDLTCGCYNAVFVFYANKPHGILFIFWKNILDKKKKQYKFSFLYFTSIINVKKTGYTIIQLFQYVF